ncbi:MAG: hypothetical protein HWE22_04915 [Flavobacteriales bacterium]|nr:hypothetical protein [Flavobacteriales bacterium]
MWIFQFFKHALGGAFDYFSIRIKGRFAAFAIQLVLSYLLVGVFTYIIAMLASPLFYGGSFSLNIISVDVLYDWALLIDPAWTVTMVVAVNFLFRTDLSNKRMKFADFYNKRTSTFWFELFLAVSLLTILLIIYHRNDLYYPISYGNDLDFLLGQGFGDNMEFLGPLIENWLYYISLSLPIIAIVVLEIRERKRNGVVLKHPMWKMLVVAIILGFFVSWSMDAFLRMFGDLVLTLIYAPFEMMEIPIILGVLTTIFFTTFKFIALSTIYHFTIQYGTQENKERVLFSETSEDLLDN